MFVMLRLSFLAETSLIFFSSSGLEHMLKSANSTRIVPVSAVLETDDWRVVCGTISNCDVLYAPVIAELVEDFEVVSISHLRRGG